MHRRRSEWTPQPESNPRPPADPPGMLAGVALCHHHGATLTGLRTAHGSAEGLARRVSEIARQCPGCIEAGVAIQSAVKGSRSDEDREVAHGDTPAAQRRSDRVLRAAALGVGEQQ